MRDAARKHRVAVDALPALLAETRASLDGIDAGAGHWKWRSAGPRAPRGLRAAAREPFAARGRGRDQARQAVEAELPPLRLDRARMRVELEPLPEDDWGAEGAERVAFEVCTNPGQPFGPLARIASGGELSRFMLALKVVAGRVSIPRRR